MGSKHLKKGRLSGTRLPSRTKPVAIVQLQGYPRQRRNRYVAVLQILLVYEAACRILEQCTPQAALHSVDREIQVDVFKQNCTLLHPERNSFSEAEERLERHGPANQSYRHYHDVSRTASGSVRAKARAPPR